MPAPKAVQVFASSVTIDGDVVTTVVALLDDGGVAYTGTTEGAEWHRLPPIPSADEAD